MSDAWSIAVAADALLAGLAFPDPAPDRRLTDRETKDVGQDLAPGLVLVMSDDADPRELSNNRLRLSYSLLVLLVTPRGHTPEQARYRKDVRQLVRENLFVSTLGTLPRFANVTYDPAPAFSAASWGDNYDVRGQRFTWEVEGPRAV